MFNLSCYTFYYSMMKLKTGERLEWAPCGYIGCCLLFLIPAMYFFTQVMMMMMGSHKITESVTRNSFQNEKSSLLSPAESRYKKIGLMIIFLDTYH